MIYVSAMRTRAVKITLLRHRLTRFNLGRCTLLAKALGVSPQRASQVLTGVKSLGPRAAMKIGKLIGARWTTVYEWANGKNGGPE